MQSSSVVLPAPFWPMRPTISPGATERDATRAHEDPAEGHVDPLALQHGGTASGEIDDRRNAHPRAQTPCRIVAVEKDRTQQVGPTRKLGRGAVEPHLALLHEDRPFGETRPRC